MNYNSVQLFMHQLYSSMAETLELEHIDKDHRLDPKRIDRAVDLEMQRLRADLARQEETFVEQMMLENPVVVERRPNTTPRLTSTPEEHAAADATAQAEMQKQRAESCRRSRINNKIKKAKSKFRHKHIAQKLAHSAQILHCIREVVAHAESELFDKGCPHTTFQELRAVYGMDIPRPRLDDLGALAQLDQ